MNIPSLPTDNLYKFLAISGLVLVGLGFYILSIRFTTLEDRFEDLYIRGKYDSIIDSERDNYIKELNNDSISIAQLDSLVKQTRKSYDKKFPMDVFSVDYVRYMDRSVYHSVFTILLAIGFGLMSIGFWLWYNKHQKYIDAERKWKGEIFVELLKEKELMEKTQREPEAETQEPDTESESDS